MDVTTGTDTDEGLVRAMAQGDTAALARAFDRYAVATRRVRVEGLLHVA
ncbi:hypothetical protein [Curtobacterium sp. VKM Ac-1376]|nr:hypothetical protein [Curtobacterium sp. VKM Ac-1376]MBF4613950.1 hypothetical protein [Curtobacterium sp. VKM Ac-1376]